MLRSSSGVPCLPPAMRAVLIETPSGAMRQNSVSIVLLIDGTRSPIRPLQPYIWAIPCLAGRRESADETGYVGQVFDRANRSGNGCRRRFGPIEPQRQAAFEFFDHHGLRHRRHQAAGNGTAYGPP